MSDLMILYDYYVEQALIQGNDGEEFYNMNMLIARSIANEIERMI